MGNGNMGFGVWVWGIGDWGLGPIPNPQSPIPNPQSPLNLNIYFLKIIKQKYFFLSIIYINN